MAKGKTPTYEEFLAQHSAGLRSLGFDEQFACFVNHLLDLRADEYISYEKEDDIAIKRKDNTGQAPKSIYKGSIPTLR